MIHVIAHTQAQPGKGREIVSLSKILIAETRKEKGCISYDLYQKPMRRTRWSLSRHGKAARRWRRIFTRRISAPSARRPPG